MALVRLRPALLLLLSAAVIFCEGQDICDDATLTNCDLCINKSPDCVWCPLTSVASSLREQFPDVVNYRCRSRDSALHQNTFCGAEGQPKVLEDPRSSFNITRNENRSQTAVIDEPTIQVSPQNIDLKLRRGDPVSFEMTFRSLRNTPLDVYFLFDFSASLNSVIETLRGNVITIAEGLQDISTAYHIGLGTFVDKPTLPYATTSNTQFVSATNRTIECRPGIAEPCIPAYGFRHFFSLAQDQEGFSRAINASSISGNSDSIEGGLDAVLQATVCDNIIGWRNNSLRMLFYISDQGYHLAGDGKLSGSYRPNDGQCHLEQVELDDAMMTRVHEYNYSTLQDYPSVRQVRDAMFEANIVPIFVIRASNNSRDRFLGPYEALAEQLGLGALARQLDRLRETDIVTLADVIREAYENTSQSIRPVANIEGYQFEFTPIAGCDTTDASGACIVTFGNEVTYNVTVTLESCDDPSVRDFQIVGPPFKFTTVQLIPQCSCECSAAPVRNNETCSGLGERVCGVCVCDVDQVTNMPLRFGDNCQCEEEVQECPVVNGMDCSGRGVCDGCGDCNCDEGFLGNACQCEFDQCPMGLVNGTQQICTLRGNCVCENNNELCECDIALSTPTMDYRYFEDTVNNDGNCECDPNVCYNEEAMGLCATRDPDGNYVDSPDSCTCGGCICGLDLLNINNTCLSETQACADEELCSRCRVQENPPAECSSCNLARYVLIGVDDDLPDEYRTVCDLLLDGCTYTFYLTERPGANVLVSEDPDCPTGALPWIIAGSLVGAILLLGLLALILLKLLFVALDRVEYRKFTKELQQADFAPHENPLYLTPQQDYQNPLRRSTSKRSN